MKKLFLSIFTLGMMLACNSIHEFPGENPYDPYMIDVSLSIDIDMKMDDEIMYQTYANTMTDHDIRYVVDIYERNPEAMRSVSNRVKRIVKTEKTVISKGLYRIHNELLLPQKDYKIIVWIDFVDRETANDKHYDTEDLQKISIKRDGEGKYRPYHEARDVFAGNAEMNLTAYKNQRFINHTVVMSVKRPFAVYQIITTDIEKYAAKTYAQDYSEAAPSVSNVAYNLFFPMGYNTYLHAPDNFRAGVGYRHEVTEPTPQKEALLAMDMVFVEDDTFYSVDFEVMNGANAHINTVRDLKINLKRNKLTIIKGEFLTKSINNGSVGINDGFDEEIIVEL